MFIKHFLFFIILCITTHNNARDEDTAHVWEGNLALPISQQPTPLFAFGQNIVAKGDFQLFAQIDYLRGNQNKFTEVIPGILFGVTNNLSLFFNMPVAARFEFNQNRSSGIEDIWLQAEYAFYNRDEERYALQSTLIGIFFFPTSRSPSLGVNAPTILIGTTISYTGVDWYAYISPEGLFSLNPENNEVNNKFLYQAGFGRNIAYSSKKWILTPLLEIYGTMSRNPTTQSLFFTTGTAGNNLFIGPTIWFATQRFILQAGILISVAQTKETESLNKNNYWAAVNIGWKFI